VNSAGGPWLQVCLRALDLHHGYLYRRGRCRLDESPRFRLRLTLRDSVRRGQKNHHPYGGSHETPGNVTKVPHRRAPPGWQDRHDAPSMLIGRRCCCSRALRLPRGRREAPCANRCSCGRRRRRTRRSPAEFPRLRARLPRLFARPHSPASLRRPRAPPGALRCPGLCGWPSRAEAWPVEGRLSE
jgi:hypothetical protein